MGSTPTNPWPPSPTGNPTPPRDTPKPAAVEPVGDDGPLPDPPSDDSVDDIAS